jgi:predicted RNase H-like HicB family nuclease
MPVDFAALAGSISSVPGVRAALLLSREGLALAVAPESEEGRLMSVWARLAGLGEVERGFVNVDGGMWVFARRGPFVAMALADGAARPGVVLAEIEQALLVAEEDRHRDRAEIRSGQPKPVSEAVPSGRFRAMLHRDRPVGPEEARPSLDLSERGTAEPHAGVEEEVEVDAVELAREFGGLHTRGETEEEE